MKLQESIPVIITGSHERAASGTVERRVWEKKERALRGFKAWMICWGIAMGAALIPLLHFILVPFFILAGPVAFQWVNGQEEIILGGKGTCPDCNREFEIVRTSVKWPLSDLCNHCHSQLRIEKLTPSSEISLPVSGAEHESDQT
jgi:hypothetical protein